AGTLSISGRVTPAGTGSGTTLTLSGASTGTITANASGAYSFQTLSNGSYTVTSRKAGVVFTSVSQSVTLSGTSATVNFTAATLQSIAVIPVTVTISAGGTKQFVATVTY